MHIQPFQALYPIAELIPSPDYFFSTMKDKYGEYYQGGFFKKMAQEGLYIHRISAQHRTFLGLIACVDMQDYLAGHIKRHENTIPMAEQEQVRQVLLRNAQTKPVMLTYRNAPEVNDLLAQYAASTPSFMEVWFDEIAEKHAFWAISQTPIIRELQDFFLKNIPLAYIADGHHRSAVAAKLFLRNGPDDPENPYRWLVCALYPASELEIHDFNRIITGLTELSPTMFMAKLSRIFEIDLLDEAQKPNAKYELTMLLDHEWYRLHWRPHVLDACKGDDILLDVNLLNRLVLGDILGIVDVQSDPRIKYVEGPRGLDNVREKTLKNDERLAFCLYPISMEDFLAVSETDGVLPPKSTWFEPRIRSGLIVRQFLPH